MDMQFFKDFILAVAPVLLGAYIAWCEKRAKAREDQIKNMHDSINSLQSAITGFQLQEQEHAGRQEELIATCEQLHDKIIEIMEKLEITNAGVKDSLRNQIMNGCGEWLEKGWIPMDRFQNLSEMYGTYHDKMGGNGVAQKLYDDASELPFTPNGGA